MSHYTLSVIQTLLKQQLVCERSVNHHFCSLVFVNSAVNRINIQCFIQDLYKSACEKKHVYKGDSNSVHAVWLKLVNLRADLWFWLAVNNVNADLKHSLNICMQQTHIHSHINVRRLKDWSHCVFQLIKLFFTLNCMLAKKSIVNVKYFISIHDALNIFISCGICQLINPPKFLLGRSVWCWKT